MVMKMRSELLRGEVLLQHLLSRGERVCVCFSKILIGNQVFAETLVFVVNKAAEAV